MNSELSVLTNDALLDSTQHLLRTANELEVDLILHLGEIDARGLFRDRAFSSMFTFCTGELGFSEDVACRRIELARLLRRFPSLVPVLREGRIKASGLNVLAPRLTKENLATLVAECSGKTKEEIKGVLAVHFPEPDVADSIRKLPSKAARPASPPPTPSLFSPPAPSAPPSSAAPVPAAPAPQPALERRAKVEPLSPDAFLVQFTANGRLRDLLAQAKELFRHEVPNGHLATLVEKAFELLVAEKMKSRFGVGAKPRATSKPAVMQKRPSRHVPMAKRRALVEGKELQCEFVSDDGRRCQERGFLEMDHVKGFARSHEHGELRMLCRAHNQLLAERMYGRDFMLRARARDEGDTTAPGAIRASADNSVGSEQGSGAEEKVIRASADNSARRVQGSDAEEEVIRASADNFRPGGGAYIRASADDSDGAEAQEELWALLMEDPAASGAPDW